MKRRPPTSKRHAKLDLRDLGPFPSPKPDWQLVTWDIEQDSLLLLLHTGGNRTLCRTKGCGWTASGAIDGEPRCRDCTVGWGRIPSWLGNETSTLSIVWIDSIGWYKRFGSNKWVTYWGTRRALADSKGWSVGRKGRTYTGDVPLKTILKEATLYITNSGSEGPPWVWDVVKEWWVANHRGYNLIAQPDGCWSAINEMSAWTDDKAQGQCFDHIPAMRAALAFARKAG